LTRGRRLWLKLGSCIYLTSGTRGLFDRGRRLTGSRIPRDTSPDAWEAQQAALERLGGSGRVAVALDLSEAIQTIQLDGIQARHPNWSRAEAVRQLIQDRHEVSLPRDP